VTRAALLACCLVALVPNVSAGVLRSEQIARWTADLNAAELCTSSGELDRADETYTRVLAELPSSGAGLLRARALDGKGDVERLRGNRAPAIEAYRRSADLWADLLGPRQPRLAVTLHNLGAVLLDDGRTDEARTALERALAIWTSAPASTAEAENTRLLLARALRGHDGDTPALRADP
jgi:tetratricopeptide (TPR) repeat protein